MLRRFSLLSACLFAACINELSGQISMGFKAGPSLPTLKASGTKDQLALNYSFAPAFHAGVMADQYFDDWFYLRMEILYDLKGAKYERINSGGKGNIALGYLSLPFILCIKPNYKLNLNFGAQFGYMLTGKHTLSFQNKGRDFSLLAGIGYYLTPKLEIEARYSHGVSVISRTYLLDSGGNQTGAADTRNQTFQLSIGYFLLRE